MLDNNVLKYIPKKLHKDITHCDRFKNFDNKYTYNVIFNYEKVNGEETSIMADGLDGLKWAIKEVIKGERGTIYA